MKKLILAIPIATLVLFSTVNANPPVMGEPIRGPDYDLLKVIASSNNVYLLWGHGGTLYFQRSIDGGATFEKPLGVVESKGGTSVGPQMSVSGNNVYIALNYVDNGTSYLDFTRSTDNGASFINATTLSSKNILGFLTLDIISSDSRVYLVWDENGEGIFLKKSEDGGATFGKDIDINNGTKSFGDPHTAISDNNVYMVFDSDCIINVENQQICHPAPFLRMSNDGGDTFGKLVALVNNTDVGFSTDPQISVTGNNVYLVWLYNPPYIGKIGFSKSNDSGSTFSKPFYFDINGQEGKPVVASSGNNVYLIWQSQNGNTNDIFFTQSTDRGNTFGPTINLSNNAGYSSNYYLFRQIAISGDNVYVTWSQRMAGENHIFLTKSSDNGANFDKPVNLSENLNSILHEQLNQTTINFDYPQIASYENNVYVGWTNNLQGNNLLLLRASSDNGDTFENPTILNNIAAVPEFQFVVPMLLASFVSVIVFYNMRFRK